MAAPKPRAISPSAAHGWISWARPGTRNRYGDVVDTALWRAAHGGNADVYAAIIEALVAAGGAVPERHPLVNETIDALLARYGSVADAGRYWWGEEPR